MKFDIYNLTDETITASTSRAEAAVFVYLQPQKPTQAPAGSEKHVYLSTSATISSSSAAATDEKPKTVYEVPVPGVWKKRYGSWGEVTPSEEGCPWRVFCHFAAQALIVIPNRNVSSFLADMPDSLPLSSLLLPGTHDTMAFYGWPISQCQEEYTPLSTQLLAGIRVIDVRLAAVPVTAKYLPTSTPDVNAQPAVTATMPTPELRLIAYHGIYPQRTPFTTILSTIHTFLNSPAGSSETIVMSLKQEDDTTTSRDVWSRLVREDMMQSPGGFGNTGPNGKRDMGMWFLQNRIPKLGEVRGKVVLFSRFSGDSDNWEGGYHNGMGIHPTRWPDSDRSGFAWNSNETTVRTHDWYAIPSFLSIPEKVALATTVLYPTMPVPLTFPIPSSPPADDPDRPQLSITYLSAATFPLALPPYIAKGFGWPALKFGFEGVNSRAARWLLEELVPDLKNVPAAELHGKATANADVNTATAEGPVDPDDLRRKKLRWFNQKSGKEKEKRGDGGEGDGCVKVEAKGDSPVDEEKRRVAPGLTSDPRRLRGWVLLDYYSSDKGLVPLLIECNYRGRKSGQEGWP